MDGQPFVERLRLRYAWAMAGANLAGGLVVWEVRGGITLRGRAALTQVAVPTQRTVSLDSA